MVAAFCMAATSASRPPCWAIRHLAAGDGTMRSSNMALVPFRLDLRKGARCPLTMGNLPRFMYQPLVHLLSRERPSLWRS